MLAQISKEKVLSSLPNVAFLEMESENIGWSNAWVSKLSIFGGNTPSETIFCSA